MSHMIVIIGNDTIYVYLYLYYLYKLHITIFNWLD